MRGTSLIVLVLLSGCASIPAPTPVFQEFEPMELGEAKKIPEIPHVPAPIRLERIPCDRPTPCYTGAVDAPELRAWTLENASTALTALQLGVISREAAIEYQTALLAAESEINALIRLGRLTEAQQAIQHQQTLFYLSQYRIEWWTSRIVLTLAAVGFIIR